MNLLIAEDNPELSHALKIYFEKEGYQVFLARDGVEALDIFSKQQIEIIVLDWMMPKLNGIEVCRELKQFSRTKVLILTAKIETENELFALNTGADDYLKKPFDPRVLIARVNKLTGKKHILEISDLRVDMEKRKIYKNHVEIHTTPIEFDLLTYFMTNNGRILSKEQILNQIWGYDYNGTDRTIDTHIRRLRQKIGDNIIVTHHGLGYSVYESTK